MITLIANSGIQFHKLKLEIDTSNRNVLKNNMAFHEFFNQETVEKSLEYAYQIPDTEEYSPKIFLRDEGYLNEEDEFVEEVNLGAVLKLKEADADEPEGDSYYYKIGNIKKCLDNYENIWLPFPYFKRSKNGKSEMGPYAWSRIMLKNITPSDEKRRTVRTYEVTLAFDTAISEDNKGTYFTPKNEDTIEPFNVFAPSDNEDYNLNFCNQKYYCGWVNDYLREIRIEGELPRFKSLEYLAEYLYLIRYLTLIETSYRTEMLNIEKDLSNSLSSFQNNSRAEEQKRRKIELESYLKYNVFPVVEFYSETDDQSIDVDLVLDIGNAHTCGMLFESPNGNGANFNFNSVEKLEITNLSTHVGHTYDEPISMRLAFSKAQFGEIDIPEYQNSFSWPSLVRIGIEALELINEYNLDSDQGTETNTNNSSPKRYLWDSKKSNVPWEFVSLPIITKFKEKRKKKYVPQPLKISEQVYYEGISEQFRGDGEFTVTDNTSLMPHYSRKSLMTFVYIELFLHAISQINSHKFRKEHGKIAVPRKLKRITITCPTSIVQKEQVILRQCALDAITAINNYYCQSSEKDEINLLTDVHIIPSPKELAKNNDDALNGEKNDWIYDEASCSQLVFLYAELGQRFRENNQEFFNLYGKCREDAKYSNQKCITIGSVDIGGGTTDLMITSYEYDGPQSNTIITPKPLFWESYVCAGDELVKKVIQYVILEGGLDEDKDTVGCNGLLRKYAINKGCHDVSQKMRNFFGLDSANQTAEQRVYRKNFSVQVLIPIALKYLEHASSASDDREIGYDEIFGDIKPNEGLIRFINSYFGAGFRFEEIKWELSSKRIAAIINDTYDKIIRQISGLLAVHSCDFILLSGRVTTIPAIRDMFIRMYPVSPDRLISMHRYRVGLWYPNSEKVANKGDLGYFTETKSIVAVGAIIALMAGKLRKFSDFSLNMTEIISRLTPTTDYIGALKKLTSHVDPTYLAPDIPNVTIEVHSLPILLGYKQLPNLKYDGRPIYKLDFNEKSLRKKVLSKYDDLFGEAQIVAAIQIEKDKLNKSMPLQVELERDYDLSKEDIKIEYAEDKEGNDKTKSIHLELMTLAEEDHYWADTGEFYLSIK